MATTDKALEVLNETLKTLESGLEGKTSEINSQYKEAVALANKSHKEAIALAEKSKQEALTEFSTEKSEINKLRNAIKALTGDTSKSPKATKSSTRVDDWDGKLTKALETLGKKVSDKPQPKDILATLKSLYPDVNFEKGPIAAAWNKYKKDHK